MVRLKLHKEPEDAALPESLVFPAKALAVARKNHHDQQGRGMPTDVDEMHRTIDSTLDSMQRGLDDLKRDCENYRFPRRPTIGFDDGPPTAA